MLLRSIFSLLVCVLVSGCFFTPVYKKGTELQSVARSTLPAIKVANVGGRIGQDLKANLEDMLNPTSQDVPLEYDLLMNINKENVPLAIQKNSEVTRYNLIIKVDYSLRAISTGKTLHGGTSRITGSYGAVDSQYATFIAEEDTSRRVVQEIARDIKAKLMAYLLSK